MKEEQHQYSKFEKLGLSQQQLNVKLSKEGLYKCYGRIQEEYQIFIPRESKLAELIEETHMQTIHGRVTLTMAKVRSKYWVPTLRQLVKRVLRICYGCKNFHVKSDPAPQEGLLLVDRTNLDLPVKIIGKDYAVPVWCKSKGKKERKVYRLLFTCSLSRAIHLEVPPNQTTEEFTHALKRLVARRGRPKVIYSDNATTVVAASKWIEKINKDELMRKYLIKEEIQRTFNLSKAPWWGGKFERVVGLVKQCLYKAKGI